MAEINLGQGSNLVMNTSTIVTCHETLTLIINGGRSIDLDCTIQADFNTIPPEYHEVFMNMLTSKYCKTASFGDNPFSNCVTAKKRKWWHLWK